MDLQRNIQKFSKGDSILPVTHVIINYGYNSNGAILYKEAIATNDNGRTIEKTLTVYTDGNQVQTIANNLLAAYTGCSYQSFSAGGSQLDPACELGDSVSCNGVSTVIGALDTSFSKAMFIDVEAPHIDEDDDFPYLSQVERLYTKQERDNTTSKTSLTVTATEIRAEIQTASDEASNSLGNTRQELQGEIDGISDILETQANYMSFGANGLELGQNTSLFKALLSNTELGFYEGDTTQVANRVAYINNKALNILNAMVSGELQIGHLVFIQKESGDVAVKWRESI